MSDQVTNTSVSPLKVNVQPSIDPSSNLLDVVDKGAKDIYQSTKKAVEDQGFKRLSIISWGRRIVSKCGFLGYPLVLLVSPFLVPVSFVYDGVRGITLLYRKIAKVETLVEKLLPRTDQHVKDVEQLLNEKIASDRALKAQAEQIRVEKEQSDQLVNQLQWRNGQQMDKLQQDWVYHQSQQNGWQQANANLWGRVESAEQRVSELTQKLNQVSINRNEAEHEYQTEKARLSAELKQLSVELAQKDDQVKQLELRLVNVKDTLRVEESQNQAAMKSLLSDINQIEQALKNSENEVTKLRKKRQVLINIFNDQKTIWQEQGQQYLNTINGYKTKLDDLENRNLAEQRQLMNLLAKTQHKDLQEEESVLTMTDIFGKLRDQFKHELKCSNDFANELNNRNAQLYYQVNSLSQKCQSFQENQYQRDDREKQLQVDLDSVRDSLNVRTDECQKIKELKSNLEEKTQTLEQELKSKNSEYQQAQQQKQVEYEQLQRTAEQTRATSDAYQQQLAEQQRKAAAAESQLENLQSQL
nr:hypothetical protein [Endozoicomonas sp.]